MLVMPWKEYEQNMRNKLTPEPATDTVMLILGILYKDGKYFDSDQEWDSETLACIVDVLYNQGLVPYVFNL